ncbi:MAG: hypothetical protein PHO44_02700 [Sphaerochaetaceae bacterium]|jgi:DhnA family fructose-bisphosphate aldolase class Ia|nr:hypothetical protein [Sphaerochaetaceae bacterium]MDD3162807.1 hypothetical protein [Sphaerochaetaceae bacterium]MDD4006868.1 hypothetical protein [Sphaerochaetaceae bacterium]MDD4396000.1 hypothetical protein [Sphaerochaetaceae bacterium]
MTGLDRRMAKLLANKGKLFLAAFDHPQIYGVMKGLEDTPALVKDLKDSRLDGFILNPGMVSHVCPKSMDDKLLVLRASVGGTMFSKNYSDCHELIASPERAIELGSDAALVMFVLGGEHDQQSQVELSRVVEEYHEYGIPVIAEVLAADYEKNNDTEFIANGARVAAELGADMIKAFYCEGFERVVSNCPVPVILAGGPKGTDIVDTAKTIVAKGAVGFAFGRNIFQDPDPKALIRKLDEVLR